MASYLNFLLRHGCACAEVFPLYIMAVCGHLFSAMLVDMRAPRVPRNPGDMNTSWPYHVANLRTVACFLVNTMLACLDGAGSIYQCSYCGIAWSSTTPKVSHSKQKPKVTLLGSPAVLKDRSLHL